MTRIPIISVFLNQLTKQKLIKMTVTFSFKSSKLTLHGNNGHGRVEGSCTHDFIKVNVDHVFATTLVKAVN